MYEAKFHDKDRVVDILSNSFDTNQSVNYIVKQDHKRLKRIRALMDYSFQVCSAYGKVYLSDDKNACALVLFPDKKKSTTMLDIKLILSCIGIENIMKAMSRESKIKKLQPKDEMYYLWFIGVYPENQHNGAGTKLLNELIEDSNIMGRRMYLETSTTTNLPWYKKSGFEVYNELDLGYKLFFLKRERERK